MKHFATATAALALMAAPALADDAETKDINTPGAANYQEAPLSPDFSWYGTASLIGSDVYTTNRGVGVRDAENLTQSEVTMVGTVADVQMTNDGMLRGIIVDPVDNSDESLWYFPASDVITVNDVDGPRYMISYTEDEMSELQRIENPEMGQ